MASLVAEIMNSTFNSSATLGRLLNPSVPQFLHLHSGDAAAAEADITQFVQVVWGFNENMHVKHSENIQQMLVAIILPFKGTYGQKKAAEGLWHGRIGISWPQVHM